MHCHVVKTKDKEHGKEKRMQSFDSTWGISQKNKEMCSETERGSYNYCTDHCLMSNTFGKIKQLKSDLEYLLHA